MKKTMFITSVIMVVVMAIALTTSSLAWFTASSETTVSTNAFTINAQSMTSEGLYIARDTANFSVNPITLADATSSNTYWPMVPLVGSTTIDADGLLGALQDDAFIGNKTRNVGTTTYWQGDAYTTNFFKDQLIYVANAGTGDVQIEATVDFESVVGGSLYVAVLGATYDSSNEFDEWELIALESSTTDATAVSVLCGKTTAMFAEEEPLADAIGSVAPTAVLNSETTTVLAGTSNGSAWGGWMQFKVLAWFVGNELTNNNSSTTTATFTVNFSIAD